MQRCTPLNQAAAMLKLSDQSDPDLQRYLRHTYTHRQTHTHRQRFLVFIEIAAENLNQIVALKSCDT